MEEKTNELTEVPLSNREVLKVLKARINNEENGQKHHSRTNEMIEYLESVEGVYKYPLEVLRDLKTTKGLDADLATLATVSNISDLSIISESDRKRIEQYFKNKNNTSRR